MGDDRTALADDLDRMRNDLGLSYSALRRRARDLPSRPDRARDLPSSTLSDLLTGSRLPTRPTLLAFLGACGIADGSAEERTWLSAWTAASRDASMDAVGTIEVVQADPLLLGVHRAMSGLPSYVERDHDRGHGGVRGRLREAAEAGGGLVLLVGPAVSGKTRSAFEAVRTCLPNWSLWAPDDAAALVASCPDLPDRTVVWLDEFHRYLEGNVTVPPGLVTSASRDRRRLVFVATMWPERYAVYTAAPPSERRSGREPKPEDAADDPHAKRRTLLRSAAVVTVRHAFSPSEVDRARLVASDDHAVAQALTGSTGHGLTQTLALVPELRHRWHAPSSPYAAALLDAAIDTARLGGPEVLTAALLNSAAPGYCSAEDRARAPQDWFEHALAWLSEPISGVIALLSPQAGAGLAMGEICGYRLHDDIVQSGTRSRARCRVPASLWDALVAAPNLGPEVVLRLGLFAADHLLLGYAEIFLRRVAVAGETRAVDALAALLEGQGREEDLDRVLAGLPSHHRPSVFDRSSISYYRALIRHGREDEVLAHMASGDCDHQGAALAWTRHLAQRGRLDELRDLANRGVGPAVEPFLAGLCRGGKHEAAVAWAVEHATDADFSEPALALMRVANQPQNEALLVLVAESSHPRAHQARWWLAQRAWNAGDVARTLTLLELKAGALLVTLVSLHGSPGTGRAVDPVDRSPHRASTAAVRPAAIGHALDLAVEEVRECRSGGSERRWSLYHFLARHGALEHLLTLTDEGDGVARRLAADLLETAGDVDRALALLRDGDEIKRAHVLLRHGRRSEVLALARRHPTVPELDGVRRLALVDEGKLEAAFSGLDDLTDRGGVTRRRLFDRLAGLGRHDELRTRADAGDPTAALVLSQVLAEQGDAIELGRRSSAGDRSAADAAADLWRGRGDLEQALEHSLRADRSGHSPRTVGLLLRTGRLAEAEEALRAQVLAKKRHNEYQEEIELMDDDCPHEDDLEWLVAQGRGEEALAALRLMADAGDPQAERWLPFLLLDLGHDDEVPAPWDTGHLHTDVPGPRPRQWAEPWFRALGRRFGEETMKRARTWGFEADGTVRIGPPAAPP